MEIAVALLADYANVSQEGKLNVLGIFTQLNAQSFPCVHPQLQLIIMWQAPRTESGRKKDMEIRLDDADGKKLFSINAQFLVPDGKPGRLVSGNHIIGLNGIRFDRPGAYEFNILIGGEQKASAPFEVVQIPPTKQG